MKGPQCNSHSTGDLEQIRNVRFDARPKDGWSFAISSVRHSRGKKVVDLYSTIDPIAPGYACGVLYRIVLDASGSRILSSDMISSDFMVSARSNPSGQRSGDQ